MPIPRVVKQCIMGAVIAWGACAEARMTADPTGIWYDPAQSGWGLSLFQQDDIVFGTLFVYDQDHRAAWYAATDMRTTLPLPQGAATPEVEGTLYRFSGPWFGGAWDSSLLAPSPAGHIKVAYPNFDTSRLQLTYTIDGHTVDATVRPLTWATNRALIKGQYAGGLFLPNRSLNCTALEFTPRGGVFGALTNAQLDGIRFEWATGTDTACTLETLYTQEGQRGRLAGVLFCGPLGSAINVGSLQVRDLQVSEHGFSGKATLTRDDCTYDGHFGGVAN